MDNDWNDNWALLLRGEKVLDALGAQYGTFNPKSGKVTFARIDGDRILTLNLSDIESIEGVAVGKAEIKTKNGEVHTCEGIPEGKPLTSQSFEAAVMEPSGDSIYDMRRMMEALGIPERCHTDALSGIRRIDLRGIVEGGRIIRIGDEAVPYLREILAKNQSLMSQRIRVGERGILENLGFFAEKREVNDFLDAIGEPTAGDAGERWQFDVLEACGGTVPEMADDEKRSFYLSNALEAFMLAVIQRQFEPTIVDMCLLLIGPQGVGKSNFARMLGGKFVIIEGRECQSWFRSTEVGFKDHRKLMESVSGAVIAEMAEGKQLRDTKGIKAFLDKDMEQYRRAYRRDEEVLPIRPGIIITHNEDRPIMDDTGGRRFLPVWMTGEGLRDPKEITLEEWRGRWRRAWAIFIERRNAGIKDPWREPFERIQSMLPEIQRMAMASALYDDDIIAVLDEIEPGEKLTIKEMEDLLRAGLWGRIDPLHIGDAIERFKKDPARFGFKHGTQNLGERGRAKGYRKLRGRPSQTSYPSRLEGIFFRLN